MHFSERKTDFRDAWPQWVQKEKKWGPDRCSGSSETGTKTMVWMTAWSTVCVVRRGGLANSKDSRISHGTLVLPDRKSVV